VNEDYEDDDDSSPSVNAIDKMVNGPRTPPETKPTILVTVKEEMDIEEPTVMTRSRFNSELPLITQIKQEVEIKEEVIIKEEVVIKEEETPAEPEPPQIKKEPPEEQPTRVKRKLSISEYRERVKSIPVKKETDSTQPTTPNTNGPVSTPGSSTEEEDDAPSSPEFLTKTITFPPSLASLANDTKKGGNGGTKGFSPAPTLVEQQREALTDRLRREFGLFLSDDEEEKRRPQTTTTTIPELVPVAPPPPPPPVTVVGDTLLARKRRREAPPPPPPPPPLPPSHWVYYPPTHYHMQPHH